MTKAANHALTSILVLGLVAVSGDAFAKPGQTQKQAKPRSAKRVQVAKAKADAATAPKASADAQAVVNAVVAKATATPAASNVAEPPNPDALLAGLAPAVKSAPAGASVDALVAKACALGEKPVAKAPAKAKAATARLAYMRSVTSRASSLGFAPIAREGARPSGDHMVVRIEDRPLAQGVVRGVVRAQRRDVTACHEAAAVSGKAPRGNVMLRFAVDATGKVTRASVVAAGANHKGFERCLEGRIRGWKFPKGETETKVAYPLTLQ